jgi:hypothetical protein
MRNFNKAIILKIISLILLTHGSVVLCDLRIVSPSETITMPSTVTSLNYSDPANLTNKFLVATTTGLHVISITAANIPKMTKVALLSSQITSAPLGWDPNDIKNI